MLTDVRREVLSDAVVLDGRTLTGRTVAGIADGVLAPAAEAEPAALERVENAWRAAVRHAATGRVYGRSTGVGANRGVAAGDEGHGLRLLRSHAGATGRQLPAREVRAMLAVRANQLLAGGAGLRPDVVPALLTALRNGAHPVVHEHGSVGTGDLAALAQTGLALADEHPWEGNGKPPPPVALDTGDALALISSSALTLGQSALALQEFRRLLDATLSVGALSLLAVGGSWEPYAEAVHLARPHPGSLAAAARMRALLGAPARPAPPAPEARIQDPFGFRCLPQVHGPALDAADALDRVLRTDLNAAAENPLIDAAGALHHGNFYAGHVTHALDGLRPAVLQTARLSTARLASLVEPGLTGLRPFLGDEAPASSGVMILEYAAASALTELATLAQPAALHHAVLSRGAEEQAAFANVAARQALRMPELHRQVLACELVAAVRALRMRGTVPDPATLAGRVYELASAVLDPDTADRPLTADVAAAAGILDRLGTVGSDGNPADENGCAVENRRDSREERG